VKQVLLQRGSVVVADVPAPTVEPGTVTVRVEFSSISTGTELSGIKTGSTPLWQRALKQPDKALKVARSVATRGLGETRQMVEARLGGPQATGYSAAGVIEKVGDGIDDLQNGDRVGCAGAGLANHAEIVRIPRNLVARIPDGVSSADASTVTLGAIALQGVRRAQPTLGETFVVIGLGIIGQLTSQLLRVNGCRVIGTDLDPSRVAVATELGMNIGLTGSASDVERVVELTDSVGADGVIITAATPSSHVVSSAFRMCRKKGRVVLVGDVGLDLNRADFYEKEIDFFISTSYGPGRYDRRYEERGLDYPIGYVRWTENRNMQEYLRLLGEGRIQLGPLVGATFPVAEAAAAYAALESAEARPISVRLSYPDRGIEPERTVRNPSAPPAKPGTIKVALVGAGSFAKGVHLPNLQSLSADYHEQTVVSRSGPNASATAARYGAKYATTDFDAALADPEIDLVLIATHHDLHASQALRALEAGKNVLVEKPLALNAGELGEFTAFFERAGERPSPILLTGFNRRFSPFAARIAELIGKRSSPLVMSYRMNAGFLPRDHWTQGPEGGGRNIGEASHIYDLFTFLTGSRVSGVHAGAIKPRGRFASSDNFVATISFEDGSIGSLTYTAMGSSEHPKEQLEVFVDGTVLALDDYRVLTVKGTDAPGLITKASEKGQREELLALASAIHSGGPWPSPLWQQVQAMEIAFAVEPFLASTP
jgi:predicted dehydrogenase/threonine dehydrogenase-like Zn-dependent dehydrogenase